jgi:hypothetical protein
VLEGLPPLIPLLAKDLPRRGNHFQRSFSCGSAVPHSMKT